jgi:hypothetical protein
MATGAITRQPRTRSDCSPRVKPAKEALKQSTLQSAASRAIALGAHGSVPMTTVAIPESEASLSGGSAPASPQGAGQNRHALMVQRQTPAPGGGSGGASVCAIPPGCPPEFCTPFPGGSIAAGLARDAAAPFLLAGIGVKVSPRVVPLWSQYLFGGAAPQNLTATFGSDFANSATTSGTTDFLVDELRQNLESSPPTFAVGNPVTSVDIPTRIPAAITAIGTPGDPNQMDFNVIGEIPGNIAGGIGKNQTACPVGAKPSPFDDDRAAAGSALVTQNADGSLTVVPAITFTVKDTIDLCPGNCGAKIEQTATVPMSRFEASGVSGDVPFTVQFPAPFRSFVAHPAPTPVTPPTPPAAPGPIAGQVTASALRIRSAPNTSSAILGFYPSGSTITIICQTTGEVVEGNSIWDKTDRGFVSDRFVSRSGASSPPSC